MQDKRSVPRQIEYRWFVAGAEVTPEQFWAELKRLGGRATVESVDLTEPRYRPTPAAEAVLGESLDLSACDHCGASFPNGGDRTARACRACRACREDQEAPYYDGDADRLVRPGEGR